MSRDQSSTDLTIFLCTYTFQILKIFTWYWEPDVFSNLFLSCSVPQFHTCMIIMRLIGFSAQCCGCKTFKYYKWKWTVIWTGNLDWLREKAIHHIVKMNWIKQAKKSLSHISFTIVWGEPFTRLKRIVRIGKTLFSFMRQKEART